MFINFTYEGNIGGKPVSGVGITELAARNIIDEKISACKRRGGGVNLICKGYLIDIIFDELFDEISYKIPENGGSACTQLLGLEDR
jgi:hypothetical protein